MTKLLPATLLLLMIGSYNVYALNCPRLKYIQAEDFSHVEKGPNSYLVSHSSFFHTDRNWNLYLEIPASEVASTDDVLQKSHLFLKDMIGDSIPVHYDQSTWVCTYWLPHHGYYAYAYASINR